MPVLGRCSQTDRGWGPRQRRLVAKSAEPENPAPAFPPLKPPGRHEELQTVNHELQARLDELSRTSDDMKNLLNSTDIATLFLDDALRVRRFTPRTASIIKLIPGDAGRLVTDLVTQLDYPAMAEDVREVLRSLVFQEHQVASRDGRWFTARIMPYRTQDNVIDGVVVTFIDITAIKQLEAQLRK